MILCLLHNGTLAARGDEGNWVQLIIFLVIGAFYLLSKIFKGSGEQTNNRPGQSEPEHYEQASSDYEEVEIEQKEQPVAVDNSQGDAEVLARSTYLRAMEKARRDFEERNAKIHEYEERLRTSRMNESVRQQWHEKLDEARKQAKDQYETDRQTVRQKYVDVTRRTKISTVRQGTVPPVRPQPQEQLQPAYQHEQHPPAYDYDQHQISAVSKKPETVSPAKETQPQKAPTASSSYHPDIPSLAFVSFTQSEMKRAIIFAEVLGKPIALRQDYDSTSGF